MSKSKVKKSKRQPHCTEELAGKTFTVHVTRADIRKGKPSNANWCPIALALRRATGAKRVEVDGCSIHVDGLKTIDSVPDHIDTFISAFDDVHGTDHFDDGKHRPALKRVQPFSFRLTLPRPEIEAVDGEVRIL